MRPMKDSFRDKENLEIEENAKKAFRRIYQNDSFLEPLAKQLKLYDNDKDGVMSRNILKQALSEVTKDANEDDLNYIVQFADKRNKGYFCPELFLDNLTKLAQEEARNDLVLRRLGNILKHKGIDLEKELMKNSKNNSGVLETFDFMRVMRELRIGLAGDDMDDLIRFASGGDKYVDIKAFCKKVKDAMDAKPIVVTAPKTNKTDIAKKKSELNYNEQKKIQNKLQSVTNQLIDAKKELEKVEKNAADWKAIAEKNEKALNVLSNKLMDPKDKIKKVGEIQQPGNMTKLLKQQLRQQEKILELTDKVIELQAKNEDLERFVKVDTRNQLDSYELQTKEAIKKMNSIRSENISLQNQIDKLVNATSEFDRNEEAEYAKQMSSKNFEARIRELEANERQLQEELLKSEHANLEMKFEKENNGVKVAALKDKIYELENYIQIYTQLPPSMISKVQADKEFDIEKELSMKPGASKRPAIELEKVIEGLKRVINTQRAELEALRKKESKYKKAQEKVSTNKLLKDEIEHLETELKTFEDKDVEIGSLKLQTEKLSRANKALMNDIKNEQKRYDFLESKYKELLVKYNIAAKDLEKKQDSLFTLSTGANRATYEEYLHHKENQNYDDE